MVTEGQLTSISHRDSQPQLWMTVGKVVSENSDKITWHFEWMPCLEKFFEKSWQAFSSWNLTCKGEKSEDNDLDRRGFRDGVVLGLGAMCRLWEREREKQKSTINKLYHKGNEKVCMHKQCMIMWHAKKNASWFQPNPILLAYKVRTYKTHIYNA